MPTSRNRPKHVASSRERARRSFQGGMADRVSNRELRRRAAFSIRAGRQVYATLLAVLAQKGGEVVVTQGTLDQVNENYGSLGFVVETMGGGEFRVRMTQGDMTCTPGASATPSDSPVETLPISSSSPEEDTSHVDA